MADFPSSIRCGVANGGTMNFDAVLKGLLAVTCLVVIYASYLYIRKETGPYDPCADRYGKGTNAYEVCIQNRIQW